LIPVLFGKETVGRLEAMTETVLAVARDRRTENRAKNALKSKRKLRCKAACR
jgi:hypothetical protein